MWTQIQAFTVRDREQKDTKGRYQKKERRGGGGREKKTTAFGGVASRELRELYQNFGSTLGAVGGSLMVNVLYDVVCEWGPHGGFNSRSTIRHGSSGVVFFYFFFFRFLLFSFWGSKRSFFLLYS